MGVPIRFDSAVGDMNEGEPMSRAFNKLPKLTPLSKKDETRCPHLLIGRPLLTLGNDKDLWFEGGSLKESIDDGGFASRELETDTVVSSIGADSTS